MESDQPVHRIGNAELRKGRVIRISYKRATYVVCTVNLMLAVCLMYSILSPLHLKSHTPHVIAVDTSNGRRPSSQRTTREELVRLRSSDKLRRDMVPIHLIQEVKVLQAETMEEITRTKKLSSIRQKKSIEVLQRLAQVRRGNTQANQQGLQKWRKKKLLDAKRIEAAQRGR
ncbi:uncharacterized protein [Physcomitrium patens]|uniref:Uncharacterized protein n=1 Tax=Physcomitrium patens TaxID=3218 RepID=A0A7I4DB37_PHYPA|nr:uncharacterized protein LOC112273374 isoform X2 [Physcomitrium patens]|eukprot:XP_024357844.1 uncharacterized protein LOC112273374 isoform X2 [Physcomitrella patens]